MKLTKVLKLVLLTTIAFGLFMQADAARAEGENTRPRRVAGSNENDEERRTGVSVERNQKHGVVRRNAVAVGKGTAKGASSAAKGTAKGATYAAKGTAKGAEAAADGTAKGATVAGKSTAKGAKVAAKSTKNAGKKVVDAFK